VKGVKRKRPRAASLLSISAGCVFIIGALLPWAQLYGPDRSYTAFQLGMYGSAGAVIAAGVALIATGLMDSAWTSPIAMGGLFVAIFTQLGAHTALYQALTRLGQTVGGDIGHVGGFGTTVVFAGAATALVTAVAGAISAEPTVVVTPVHDPGEAGPKVFSVPARTAAMGHSDDS
jgi:hypothetical protein